MKNFNVKTNLRDSMKPFLRKMEEGVKKNFLELSYGILQSRTAILSQAARTVLVRRGKEKGILFYKGSIHKWVEKMSNFLGDLKWMAVLLPIHFKRMRARQKEWQAIVHDGSDIAKRWAEEMEGLSTIRDGSTKEMVNGYTFFGSVGVGRKSWDIHPIDLSIINPKAEDYTSQADAEKKHILNLLNHGVGLDHLHVFDRGFDDQKWFSFLDTHLLFWLVRMTSKRNIVFRDERGCPISLAAETLIAESTFICRGKKYAREKVWVKLEFDDKGNKYHTPQMRQYTLVVIQDPKRKEPMMLLTNVEVSELENAVETYLHYLDRWAVEDYFRFLKQCFAIELMQLMTFDKLQSFLRLLMLLSDFILQQYQKGIDPLGGGLYEIMNSSYVHAQETLSESPYVISKIIADVIQEEQRISIQQNLHSHSVRTRRFQVSSEQMTMEFHCLTEP
jgi:hypothetical protein